MRTLKTCYFDGFVVAVVVAVVVVPNVAFVTVGKTVNSSPIKTGAQPSIAIIRSSRTFNDLISKRIDKKLWQVQLGCHKVLRHIKGTKLMQKVDCVVLFGQLVCCALHTHPSECEI